MAELISIDSGETTHSGLDLFGTPDTQTSILKTEDFPLTPLNQITEETINFSFNGDQYRYVDLAASYLYVRVKITKADGTNLGANANVGFVNNVLDSLFQEMRVTLEAETITPSDRCHHCKAYMHRLLSEAEAVRTRKFIQIVRADGHTVSCKRSKNVRKATIDHRCPRRSRCTVR